mgnify:CR=1 FL=1
MALQASLRGLQNFVKRYEGGQLSLELNEFLQPTLDIGEFLQQAEVQFSTQNYNTAGLSQSIAGAVPAGELWRVFSVSLSCNNLLGVGETIQFAPIVRDPGGLSVFTLDNHPGPNSFTTGVNTGKVQHGFSFPNPQIWEPGYNFEYMCTFIGGGVTLGIRFQRILA